LVQRRFSVDGTPIQLHDCHGLWTQVWEPRGQPSAGAGMPRDTPAGPWIVSV
jgi:hypothetical protein